VNPKLHRAVIHWLNSERRDREETAERALERVFRSLPLPAPSRALLDRTLLELGFSEGVTGAPVGAVAPHWALRAIATVALALSGLAVALFVPALLASFSLSRTLDWLVDVGAGFLTGLSQRLADGYLVWDVVARAGNTAAEAVATPQVFGLMLVILLLGSATFRFLASLVVVEGSSYHA